MAAQANGKTPLRIEAARFPVVIHPRQRCGPMPTCLSPVARINDFTAFPLPDLLGLILAKGS